MSKDKTLDPVNQPNVEYRDGHGFERLGILANYAWEVDPRRLLFALARYKFVGKMLSGKDTVLEIGCGDGFFSRLVAQEVRRLRISDVDPLLIADIRERPSETWAMDAVCHDILEGPMEGDFDGVYALDVLEHIPPEREGVFMDNVKASMCGNGVFVCGIPSMESQAHASPGSRAGHVNCKTGSDFKRLMEAHFSNVFLFSMNDEVVHTGFDKMAHYLLCLCVCPRPGRD